jgi:predicted enzyme related to lactoylglutathione lyase
VEIIPRDINQSLPFYIDILGFKFKERIIVNQPPLKEVVFLTLNDTMLELLSYENPAPPVPCQIGYCAMALEVDNMEDTLKYLNGKGVKTTWGPVNFGKSIRSEIQDPNGLTIELRQW